MSLTTDTILFFFNDTATTEIYTLSLHDALPISPLSNPGTQPDPYAAAPSRGTGRAHPAAAVGMARRASRGVELAAHQLHRQPVDRDARGRALRAQDRRGAQ